MTDSPRHMTAARLLRLAQRMAATAEGLTLDEIAAELEVGRRTAERARDALRDVFTLDERKDGLKTRFRLVGGLSDRLRAPTVAELAELDLAADGLEKRGEDTRADRLRALHTKMAAAMRQADRLRLAPDVEALETAQVPICNAGPQPRLAEGVLQTCQDALQAGQIIGFRYTTGAGETRWREVAPRGLLFGPRAYLVGALNDWGDPTLWRLDRISEPQLAGRPVWPAPGFNLEAFAARSFGAFQEPPRDVVLRFDTEAAEEAEAFLFHPEQTMTRLNDGRREIRFTAGGLLELARHLFAWSGTVEIVAPEELRAILRREAERSLARLQD